MPASPRSLSARPLGIAGLLVATSAWASLFLVGKQVLAHIDPVWFTWSRYTLATVLFAALLSLRPGGLPWHLLRAHGRRLAGLGFVGYFVFSVLVLLGLKHSVPSHGAVVMATMPITTQLLRWALDGMKPTRAAWLGGVLALAGVVVVSGVLEEDPAASTLPGDLLALAGTFGWIAYTRGAAKLPSLDVVQYSGLTALAAWPLLTVATLLSAVLGWTPLPPASAFAQTWHALAYVGMVPTVLAVIAYNFGVRTLGVVPGTAFLNMVPVSAVLMSAALGHPPQVHELAGVAMVVGALLIHTLSQVPRTAARRPAVPAGQTVGRCDARA